MADAKRDSNFVTGALGVSSVDNITTLPLLVDPLTGRLLVDTSGTAAIFDYLIASATAPQATKDIAYAVCDGIDDDVQINAALTAIKANGNAGGKVTLSEGNFFIGNPILLDASYLNVEGAGIGATLVKTQAASNSNGFSLTGTGNIHCSIRRMQVDCNRDNNSFGSGIRINTPWQNYDAEHVFEDLLITNCDNNGVETAVNADTRAMQFTRVHVKGTDGNGFYFPWPSITDCTFDTCIADTIALNGFYDGGANNHHINCKMFYCGSAGGNTHGFNLVGYNNYWENCEAQDNYQSGFYGDISGGDPTYRNFGNTFVNCIADSNGQNGGSTYACGFQGIGVTQWQIIGGASMVRPYPSFTQRIGISWESGATSNYVAGVFLFSNTTNYSDSSTGTNFYAPGPSSGTRTSWEDVGEINARHHGVKGDGKRIFGAVASSGSTTVTCSGASFTSADVGKKVMVYKEQFYGRITTIASVTNSTTIELAATAQVTTTSGTGYIIYGSDDAVAIQKILTYAATFVQPGSLTDSNQPAGSGQVVVRFPGDAIESLYLFSTQITIPVGVVVKAEGHLANMLANRNTPCILMQVYTGISELELENLGGTGIFAGTANVQAQIKFGDLRIWHGIGAQSAGVNVIATNVVATPSGSGGTLPANTYYYVVTWIDSTGGEGWASAEVNATTSGSTSSVALTWTAVTGAASYRIYRGTATGVENVYYTSGTNSYTDTNAASTADVPTPPGYALKMLGNEYQIGNLFVKECSVGVYHHAGSDFTCDSAFLIGCGTPIRMYTANQAHYSQVFLDSCGSSSIYPSLGGVAIDNGCSDIAFGSIQEFTLTGVSRTLSPVVNIGSLAGTANKDIKITALQVNNSGGTGLSMANAQDVDINMLLSNVVFSSGATNPIVTAVVYGSSLTNEIRVCGTYSSGITPSTGTQVGSHQYQLAGKYVSGTATSISTPSDPTGTTDATGLMMGLAGSITPASTGRVLFTVNGTIFNPTGIGDGAKAKLRYGTGTAPVNGGALVGTVVGAQVQYVTATTVAKVPFALTGIATGLTLGTAVWIDLQLAAITSGTATVSDVTITAVEI